MTLSLLSISAYCFQAFHISPLCIQLLTFKTNSEFCVYFDSFHRQTIKINDTNKTKPLLFEKYKIQG